MNKVYITAVPLGTNFLLGPPPEELPIRANEFVFPIHRDLLFPISNLIANTAAPKEDQVTVITVRQTNDRPNAEANFSLLQKELGQLLPDNCRLVDLAVSENQKSSDLMQLFSRIIQVLPDNAYYYADATFGAKTYPILLFAALNFAHQILPKAEIETILYREVIRKWDPTCKRNVDQEWNYYDLTSIFHMTSIINFAASSGMTESDKKQLIASLLKHEEDSSVAQ